MDDDSVQVSGETSEISGELRRTLETPSAAKQAFAAYRVPYRVGFLMDWGVDTQPVVDMYNAMRLGFDEALENGIVDRPIDLIIREVEGLPYGEFRPVLDGWQSLVDDERCIAMVGPFQSENVLAIGPYIERAGVPTISQSGSLEWGGEAHAFGLNNGTFADEAVLMARWLAEYAKSSNIGVMHEDNSLGDEYYDFFRIAARRYGLSIASDHVVNWYNTQDEARQVLEAIKSSGADAITYMGWGSPGVPNTQLALMEMGWRPHRIMTTMFMGAIRDMGYGFDDVSDEAWDGWHGMEQFDERNLIFADLLDRYEARFGWRPVHCYSAIGYDQANVLAHAIGLARPKSAQGVRAALERLRMLPSAIGGPGTFISFGPGDHRGYKGDYIVIRTMQDGMNRRYDSEHPGTRRTL